jgi:hypothetical protein
MEELLAAKAPVVGHMAEPAEHQHFSGFLCFVCPVCLFKVPQQRVANVYPALFLTAIDFARLLFLSSVKVRMCKLKEVGMRDRAGRALAFAAEDFDRFQFQLAWHSVVSPTRWSVVLSLLLDNLNRVPDLFVSPLEIGVK